MARAVEHVLNDPSTLILESGTGTGKTFAYLVPAVLSGKKILISTGTKHLQDQLFEKDLPTVCRAVGRPANAVMLKGRANYLCRHRLRTNASDPELPGFAQHHVEQVRAWAERTRSGELSELAEVPEDAAIWSLVTSTSDNCLGARCDDYDNCFVNRARRKALGADIVVVNHHLFCADLVLREDGFGKLLPGVDAVIFDEAHQLPQIASDFLGARVSAHQLRELSRDCRQEESSAGSASPGLAAGCDRLDRAIESLRTVLAGTTVRMDWDRFLSTAGTASALDELITGISELSDLLSVAAPASEGLARCHARSLALAEKLVALRDARGDESVRWVETMGRGFSLQQTPINVGRSLGALLQGCDNAWVYTSATLSVDGDFSHFQRQIGIADVQTGRWDSPFDFVRQALMYLPEGLPDPGASDYTQCVVHTVLPVLEASAGRAFLLFTSHRALQLAAEMLRTGDNDFSLLVQGEAPRARLLDQFRSLPRAVLLGTSSFWEGVDVRGESLSVVVIDKLPFEAPDEPVLRARLGLIESEGGNPFRDYQVPTAVIALRQGAGRLLRDTNDRGVLVLCDPRLTRRNYGQIFLRSLPPFPRTRDIDDVRAFFRAGQVLHEDPGD